MKRIIRALRKSWRNLFSGEPLVSDDPYYAWADERLDELARIAREGRFR